MRYCISLLVAAACFAQAPPVADSAKPPAKAGEPVKPAEPPKEKSPVTWKVKIKAIADDRSEILVWQTNETGVVDAATKPTTIGVSGQALKDSIKSWRAGDLASITYRETTSATGVTFALTDLTPRLASEINGSPKSWVLFLSLGIGLALWIWQREFIVGEDNRYSNSKLQMALWFTVIIVGYLATLLVRGFEFGSVDIPTNLLLLSGLSLITFGGAKLVTVGKNEAAKKAGEPTRNVAPVATGPNVARDLVTDAEGKADLGDFQMIVITVLAAVVYVIQLYRFLQVIEMRASVSLPDVDNTLLASFGLGQGAYLVKKAVGGVNE